MWRQGGLRTRRVGRPRAAASRCRSIISSVTPPEALEPRRLLAVFTVTSAADAGPGTLRQAIVDANAAGGADEIHFDVAGPAGAGPRRIAPASALPVVTERLTLDGTTQPLYSGTPLIELVAGPGAAGDFDGLVFEGAAADGSVVRGLAVGGFANGVVLGTAAGPVDGTVLAGSYVGLDASGEPAPNRTGVTVHGESNLIGGVGPGDRNVISANLEDGVRVVAGVGNHLQGNLIGTDVTGTGARGNEIGVSDGALNTVVGGEDVAARNVVSGNRTAGVHARISFVPHEWYSTRLRNDFVGTDVTGKKPVPNGVGVMTDHYGAFLTGSVISGNTGAGVLVRSSAGTRFDADVHFFDTRVGTDVSGSSPLPNGGAGVEVHEGYVNFLDSNSSHNAGPGILIVGGAVGFLGSKAVASHNGGPGVRVVGGRFNMGANGRISHNAGAGVATKPPAGAAPPLLTGNFAGIHSNGGLAIDLGEDGPTPNDPGGQGDANFQNAPVLTRARITYSSSGAKLHVSGTFDVAPGPLYDLEFYASASPDAHGRGQSEQYLSWKDALPAGPFEFSNESNVPGRAVYLSAYARDQLVTRVSEFSNAVFVPGPGDANADGRVNFADLVALAQNYGQTGLTWEQGDFTGDGAANFSDLVLLAQYYETGLPAATMSAIAARAFATAPVTPSRPAPARKPAGPQRGAPVFSDVPVAATGRAQSAPARR